MKKTNEGKRLQLKKDRIVRLNQDEAEFVQGGVEQQAAASTNHRFTCRLCTTAPGSVSIHTSRVSVNPTTTG